MRKGALATPSVQSVDRALSILEEVATATEPVPLGQLTALLDIDPSSAFRLANTLKRRGFLANPNGRKTYVLGPSIWRLSRKYDWSGMLISVSHPHVKRLAELTGETSHLVVREGRQAYFIDHHASTKQTLIVSRQTGELMPLYCTAHGKALLADFSLGQLTALLGAGPLERHTPRTIVSIAQLATACAEIRSKRYAVDDAEYVDEVRCMAAPIRDRDGLVVASIGISAPATRLPKGREGPFVRHVKSVASAISAALETASQSQNIR